MCSCSTQHGKGLVFVMEGLFVMHFASLPPLSVSIRASLRESPIIADMLLGFRNVINMRLFAQFFCVHTIFFLSILLVCIRNIRSVWQATNIQL